MPEASHVYRKIKNRHNDSTGVEQDLYFFKEQLFYPCKIIEVIKAVRKVWTGNFIPKFHEGVYV
jgi:hypothetical protein